MCCYSYKSFLSIFHHGGGHRLFLLCTDHSYTNTWIRTSSEENGSRNNIKFKKVNTKPNISFINRQSTI